MREERIDLDAIQIGDEVHLHYVDCPSAAQGGVVTGISLDAFTLRCGTAGVVVIFPRDEVHHATVDVPHDADECLGFVPAPRSLNDLMEFDHVVTSDGNGNITEAPRHLYAPQPYVDLDSEGQMISLAASDIHDLYEWRLLDGFSGQDRYSGPIMHESEYVGGGLETYIRENAGYYVCVEITGIREFTEEAEIDGESECVGWAVAYKEG